MKKWQNGFSRLFAAALAALFALLPLAAAAESFAVPPYESVQLTLAPRLSDGVGIVLPEEDSLSIRGHESGAYFVFEQTKTLAFTAVFGEGWSFSSTYSTFFPNDSRASVSQNSDGSVDFSFIAAAGSSVALSALDSVAVNAIAAELPKLYIEASVPFSEIDRSTWVEASFTITLGTKQFASGGFEGAGMVKGRGNSSWMFAKKPYSIKLDSKETLLDINRTKKYAIIPSYYDSSLMRNFVTYKIFRDLVGIGYTPNCEFVDVYLNGEYNGIYILVERIDFEKNKIDIDEADEEDLTGGYLIEKNIAGKFSLSDDIWFNCPYWANTVQDYFELHAPEPEGELRDAMLAYLTEYMVRVHGSVMGSSDEPYTQYIDPSSWVDFIIIQEISKNPDGNFKTSCWMYKQRGDDRLYMTAPWDFDFAYGLTNWTNGDPEHNDNDDCPNAFTPDGFMTINSSAPWFKRLYEAYPEFRMLLMERYTLYRRTLIPELFALIDEQAAYLSGVQAANYELWGRAFAPGVNRLRSFLQTRLQWLDEQWLLEDGSVDLDFALNLYGGALDFTAGEPAFVGVVRDEGSMAFANENGSGVALNVALGRGEFVNFDYRLLGENSALTLFVNGEAQPALNGGTGFENASFIAPEAGAYELRWQFTGEEGGEAYLDNVSVNFGHPLGDVNLDGSADIADAVLILRASMHLIELSREGELLGDMNGGGCIASDDALILLRRAMGLG